MTQAPNRTWAVDVAIPLHNKGPFIEKTIRSALAQTVPVRAVYVADDASADDGPEIALRLAAEDPRVHFIPSAAGRPTGECATRNRALYAGSSEIVAFIDADDWWDETYLERQLSHLTSSTIGLVHNAGRIVDGLTEQKLYDNIPGPLPPPDRQFDAVRLEQYWVGCPSAVIVRRALFELTGGFAEHVHFGGDWDMWARMAGVTRFARNPVPAVNIRVLPTYSRTRTRVEVFLLRLQVLERWADDPAFAAKALPVLRRQLLAPQLSLLLRPREFFDLPRRLREEGGTFGRRLFPTSTSYLTSVAGLPFRLAARLVRVFFRRIAR